MDEKDLSFRHLVKTLIPGLLTTLSLIFLFDLLLFLISDGAFHYLLFNFGMNHPTIFVASLIPISMFVGIIVNTFCFVYLFPLIKKKWFSTKEGLQFFAFKSEMLDKIYDHYCDHFKYENKEMFIEYFDEKAFLLNRQNISNYQHIRTGYFYYLEFQLNSILTIAFSMFVFGLNIFLRDFHIQTKVIIPDFEKYWIFGLTLFFCAVLCFLLYKAIFKNYEEYVKKEFSYMLGAFHICKGKHSA